MEQNLQDLLLGRTAKRLIEIGEVKTKVFKDRFYARVRTSIHEWLEENPNIRIISVTRQPVNFANEIRYTFIVKYVDDGG